MLVVKEYRRKPDAFKAVKVTPENAAEVANWCGGAFTEEAKPGDPSDVAVEINVPNLDGNRKVRNNGYVIKHANGRFYTCASDSFLKEYDEVGVRESPKFQQPITADDMKLTPHYVPRGQYPVGN